MNYFYENTRLKKEGEMILLGLYSDTCLVAVAIAELYLLYLFLMHTLGHVEIGQLKHESRIIFSIEL